MQQQAQAGVADVVGAATGLAGLMNAGPAELAAGVLDASWAAKLTDDPGARKALETTAQVQGGVQQAVSLARQAQQGGAEAAARGAADRGIAAAGDAAGVPAPFRPSATQPVAPPPAFQSQAAAGRRAFAHSSSAPQVGATATVPWSDGAAPVQSGAGFQQPPLRRGGGFSLGA
jgi:hypothetical protein